MAGASMYRGGIGLLWKECVDDDMKVPGSQSGVGANIL